MRPVTWANLRRMPSFQNDTSKPTLSWSAWWLWTLICAATPLFLTIASLPFDELALKDSFLEPLSGWTIFALVLAALVLPVIGQWWALSRLAPELRLRTWGGTWIGAALVWALWYVFAPALPLTTYRLASSISFIHAMGSVPSWREWFGLPWASFLATKILIALTVSALPAVILGRVTKRPRLDFLIAACVATVMTALLEQVYCFQSGLDLSSSGLDVKTLRLKCGLDAVWGASGATVLAWRLGRGTTKRVMLIVTLCLATMAPLLNYVSGPAGFQAGFPSVQKALSPTPATDQSTGAPVLSYSRTAAEYPVVRFAPDGKSFIAKSADRRLLRIDVASGAVLGQLGEPLAPYERDDLDWSPDGRFLILRTQGEAVPPTPASGRAPAHRNRYRLYALPAYQVVGEASYRDDECFEHGSASVMFELDGQSLWALCERNTPAQADSVAAVQFKVPAMTVLSVRRRGIDAEGRIEALVKTNEGIAYWHRSEHSDSSLSVRFRNLTTGQDMAQVSQLTRATLGGGLTFQGAHLEGGQIALLFCGSSSQVSDPAETDRGPPVVHSFCRTLYFDLHSGALIKKSDEANRPQAPTTSTLLAPTQRLRIETTWHSNGKAGEIIVQDEATRHERQRIRTLAQRALTFSPNGRWLVTQGIDEAVLRIYRVAP